MTALVEGTWTTIGVLALVAAALSLAASLMFLVLTFGQDREERTRPERRRLSVEEAAAETRRQDSKVQLALAVVAILVVVVLAMMGV